MKKLKNLPESMFLKLLFAFFTGAFLIASVCMPDRATMFSGLVQILTQPKNALCKQYQKLLGLDGIELTFEEEAVRAIAKMAIERKCGARGLRAIIEEVMLDTMFELPGMHEVNGCTVTAKSVAGEEKPLLTTGLRRKQSRSRRRSERDSEGNYMIGNEPSVS